MLNRFILRVFVALSFTLIESAEAQSLNESVYPVVGKPCPYFSFQDVEDSPKKNISLDQLKGKPFILDFFSTGCTSCFASFPKVNALSQTYAGKVQFLLVGHEDKYIRRAYNTFKKRGHLDLPHVYDSSVFKTFKIYGVPYILWVNAEGIVTAITSSPDVSESNLNSFVQGQPFPFSNLGEFHPETPAFNYHKPFLVDANGGPDSIFLQRSLFAAWKKGMGNFTLNKIEDYTRLGVPLQIIGWPLSALYKFAYTDRIADWTAEDTAYYGKYHYAPVYELADSSQFKFDWEFESNQFCYSQILPKECSKPEVMLRIMQDDLKNCFGYEAKVEVRDMPYLRLIHRTDAKQILQSKGGKTSEQSFMSGINFQNGSIRELINIVSYKTSLVSKDLPLLDETGITYPIDIQFEAMMTDLPDIEKAILPFGLEILPGLKEMKVLVIRDKH